MRISRLFIAVVAIVVAFSGADSKPAYAGDRQCYRGLSDPEGSCPICANTCGGAGWKCCTIVSDP